MSLTVNSRTVRHAGRTLRQASSCLKGALCRARAAPSGEARQEVETAEAERRVGEEIDRGSVDGRRGAPPGQFHAPFFGSEG